jgi:hypothetical protein
MPLRRSSLSSSSASGPKSSTIRIRVSVMLLQCS